MDNDSPHRPPTIRQVTAGFDKLSVISDDNSVSHHDSTHWREEDYLEEEGSLDSVLETICKAANVTIEESQLEESNRERTRAMEEVQKLTTKWIQQCLRTLMNTDPPKGLSHAMIDKSKSHIRAFGSFELNVHFGDSDIDLLCIGPKYVTRDMLFNQFVKMLENDDRVNNILKLRHAFVPLLKFTFRGIDIDLVYAQWDVEPDIIGDDINIFSRKYVPDQDTLLCLNGVRSTETIKKLIPKKAVFEKALRIIKFWAQQRCIYSNVMGFLGGISWSIMTAKVCIAKPYPTNCVEVIKRFFSKYMKWDKDNDDDESGSARSIRLAPALYDELYVDDEDDMMNCTEYQRNEFTEIMPILTPARPAMNCAYNVIGSTKHLIMQEIARGYDLTHDEQLTENGINWSELFRRRNFYEEAVLTPSMEQYDGENVYIRVECIPDAEMKHAKKWTGYIESNVRKLVKKLNRDLFDSTFYPFATAFKSGNSDVFFISGKYNVDFDHRQNNEDTINIVLQQFQTRIDVSSVRFDCDTKCSMQLRVFQENRLPEIIRQLRYPNGTPAGPPDLKAPGINIPPQAVQPIFVYNNLQHIQLITMPGLTTPTIPTVLPFSAPYAVNPPPLSGGNGGGHNGPMSHSRHNSPHSRGSRGRGHNHSGHNGHPNHALPQHNPVHGTPHRHHRHHPNHHHQGPPHDVHGRRMRAPAHHHGRSRGAPPRGRRSHYNPRGAARGGTFRPPPRHSQQGMMGGNGGRNAPYPHINALLNTPQSGRESDSPTPTLNGHDNLRMDPLHSKSRQSSVNSHDSDSNESTTSSGESLRNPTAPISGTQGGGGNGNGAPSTASGPQTPNANNVPNAFRNLMIPSNISSFPLVKIDPASLPHIPPLVTHSTTSANPVALPPNGLSVNQRPGMANNKSSDWAQLRTASTMKVPQTHIALAPHAYSQMQLPNTKHMSTQHRVKLPDSFNDPKNVFRPPRFGYPPSSGAKLNEEESARCYQNFQNYSHLLGAMSVDPFISHTLTNQYMSNLLALQVQQQKLQEFQQKNGLDPFNNPLISSEVMKSCNAVRDIKRNGSISPEMDPSRSPIATETLTNVPLSISDESSEGQNGKKLYSEVTGAQQMGGTGSVVEMTESEGIPDGEKGSEKENSSNKSNVAIKREKVEIESLHKVSTESNQLLLNKHNLMRIDNCNESKLRRFGSTGSTHRGNGRDRPPRRSRNSPHGNNGRNNHRGRAPRARGRGGRGRGRGRCVGRNAGRSNSRLNAHHPRNAGYDPMGGHYPMDNRGNPNHPRMGVPQSPNGPHGGPGPRGSYPYPYPPNNAHNAMRGGRGRRGPAMHNGQSHRWEGDHGGWHNGQSHRDAEHYRNANYHGHY